MKHIVEKIIIVIKNSSSRSLKQHRNVRFNVKTEIFKINPYVQPGYNMNALWKNKL